MTGNMQARIGDSALAARLGRELEGDVLFDAFSRGRYSTDASIYQIEPIGVVVPKSDEDVIRAIEIAREQNARLFELRAATELAKLKQSQGLVGQAGELLTPVYESFSEGLNTDDLRKARAVIDALN